MTFASTMDRRMKTMTGIAFAIPAVFVLAALLAPDPVNAVLWLSLLLMAGLYAFAFLFAPSGQVELTPDGREILIHRRVGPVRLPRAEVERLRVVTSDDAGTVLRTFGVGGVFGVYGRMWSTKLGSFTLWANRSGPAVLAQMRNGAKIVFTVDDPAGFVSTAGQP